MDPIRRPAELCRADPRLRREYGIALRTLHAPDPRPERDAMIAATALQRDLIVVTRNTRDFADMDVPFLNPWDDRDAQ
jgi:predicted nucleic acid-binding protein